MEPSTYGELLVKNITKSYKKVNSDNIASTEAEAKLIAQKLDLDDRINTTAKREAFITLKDHKPNFDNNPACRLINPAKSEIGKISKQILDRINKKTIEGININQWKNTTAVLNWFNNIDNKQQHTFITFDVVDFYPSISIDLLSAALQFASNYDNITSDEEQIILHAKRSYMFSTGEPWGKKTSTNFFDVTMGSYDGAETCELVGAFLLHRITVKYGNTFGLYRDDGLGITKEPPREVERIKKDLCAIFRNHGLKITIEANKKIVNFLDVTLNLNDGKYMPYAKPNNVPQYVHSKSNHPPGILKNIPESISKRLSETSSNEESFNKAAPLYQESINKSGYNHTLKFSPPLPATSQITNQRRNRSRNIIWYNPPFSKNVASNIGHEFLKIIDEEFPKSQALNKIFNRNTIKISYSCMSNVKQTIDGQNKANISKTTRNEPQKNQCNCRKQQDCPMSGHCLSESVIYQATVTTNDGKPEETYIGLTANTFKTRFNNHKASFANKAKKSSTELSKHIWDLKNNKIAHQITWKILKRAKPYNPASNRCNLCLWEKFFIICKPELATLNKRNELVSACRHSSKFILRNSVT